MRGLLLLEVVDRFGPLTLAEVTRRLGWDKASVSRTVASCVDEGWLVREDSLVRLGPRAALLGRGDAANRAAREAEVLMHAVSGVTGLPAQAYLLIGDQVVAVADAFPPSFPATVLASVRLPLWISAASKAVAAQLTPADLDTRLPEDISGDLDLTQAVSERDLDEFSRAVGPAGRSADAATTRVRDRKALDAQLAGIRKDGYFLEHGEIGAGGACLAVPWQVAGVVGAMACLATVEAIDEGRVLIERTLRAAAEVGATRESVVRAAGAAV